MEGITTAEGWTIAKVEIEIDGVRTEIPAPYNYIPAETGTIRIIITITDGTKTAEFSSDELSVKPMAYEAVQIAEADAGMYARWNEQLKMLDLNGESNPERHKYFEDAGLLETEEMIDIMDKI